MDLIEVRQSDSDTTIIKRKQDEFTLNSLMVRFSIHTQKDKQT